MGKEYSLYEAKAKLSELVRQVREGGEAVTITVHGKSAVEIRPLEQDVGPRSLEEIFAEMERRGEAYRAPGQKWTGKFPKGKAASPGAIERFLEERSRW